TLQVVEGHLGDELWTQRLPRQVLASVPAARRARQPPALRRRALLPFAPLAPGVAGDGVAPVRLEELDQLAALHGAEGARDADVLELPLVVPQSQKQRSNQGARPVLVPSETGHHAVGGAQVLDLGHLALAGQIWLVGALGDHPVEPCSL